MDYNAPSGSLDANAGYVGKTASTIGSKVPPKAVEYPQRELVAAQACAGIVPSNGDTTQLPQSIGRGLWIGTLGAGANALVGAIGGGAVAGTVLKTLNPWTRLRGIAAQTNTSATVNVTIAGIGTSGGSVAGLLKRRDGSAPAVGDVPVGIPFEFQPDGSGNFRFVAAVASEGKSAPGTYQTVFGYTTTADLSALIIPVPAGFTAFRLAIFSLGVTGTMSLRLSLDGGNTYLGEDGSSAYYNALQPSNYTGAAEYGLSFMQIGLDASDTGSTGQTDVRFLPGAVGRRFQLLSTSYSPSSATGTNGSAYRPGVNNQGSSCNTLGRVTHLKLIPTGIGSQGGGTVPGPIRAGSAFILEGLTAP